MKVQRLYCKTCGMETKAVSQGTSHGLHAFLSFITAGLWLLIWAAKTASNNAGWQCDVCGADVSAAHKRSKFRRDSKRLIVSLIVIAACCVFGDWSAFRDAPKATSTPVSVGMP